MVYLSSSSSQLTYGFKYISKISLIDPFNFGKDLRDNGDSLLNSLNSF